MNELYGLVLCGGKSSRMGTDKSELIYHHQPQYVYAFNQLSVYCKKVFLSCHDAQHEALSLAGYETLVDDERYVGIGPMAALLTAFDRFPDKSFFVLGCDYPFITARDLRALVNSRHESMEAVCFTNASLFDEPMISIYENQIRRKLLDAYHRSEMSLRYLLKASNTTRLIPDQMETIQSVDTPKH